MGIFNGKGYVTGLYGENNTKCRAEWSFKCFLCLTSYTDLEWKFSKHFGSMSTFYQKKTLSETDFLSVSILDSCIEMPQLHKLPLSQYLSVWLEFPLHFSTTFPVTPPRPTHTHTHFKDKTFSPDISLIRNLGSLYWHDTKAHLCWRSIREKW